MPQAPIKQESYKFRDKRGLASPAVNGGYWSPGYGSGNGLIRAATQTPERPNIGMLDRDTHHNVSSLGRRTLMTIGRYLYWGFPSVRGAVNEQANLSVGTFIPQFYGANKAWGSKAEEMLYEWDKICDVQGWPFDGDTLRNSMVIHSVIDGEQYTLLTETAEGYPLVQQHPAHRIGSRMDERAVTGGEFDGYRMIDGVIIDEVGRTVGYRYIGDRYNYAEPQDIAADRLFPTFFPDFSDQHHGFSGLASCAIPFGDVQKSRDYEMFAQMIGASLAFVEKNETGEADTAKAIIAGPAITSDPTTGAAQGYSSETFSKGMIRYFKAGTASGLESVKNDRPTSNQQAFEGNIIRDAFAGMEWSDIFAINPDDAGGAQMRVVIEKINRVLQKRMRMVAKAQRRIHGYALSKFIKLGLLEPDPDWWKFDYQGPARLTADEKYSSDVAVQEIASGMGTIQNECAKRNLWWEDVQDAAIAAEVRLQAACKAAGVDPNRIRLVVPNQNPQPEQQQGGQQGRTQEDDDE